MKSSNSKHLEVVEKRTFVCHEYAKAAFDITRTIFWNEQSTPPPFLKSLYSSHTVLHCNTVSDEVLEFYSGWFPLLWLKEETAQPEFSINNNLSKILIEQKAWQYALYVAYAFSNKASYLSNTYRVLDVMPLQFCLKFTGIHYSCISPIKTVMNFTNASRSEVRYQIASFNKK